MPDHLKICICTASLLVIKVAEVGIFAIMGPILWKWFRRLVGG